jgi:hypothetical protein
MSSSRSAGFAQKVGTKTFCRVGCAHRSQRVAVGTAHPTIFGQCPLREMCTRAFAHVRRRSPDLAVVADRRSPSVLTMALPNTRCSKREMGTGMRGVHHAERDDYNAARGEWVTWRSLSNG